MNVRKFGDLKIVEFDSKEDALAYANALASYRELLAMLAKAFGLISPN